MCEALKSEKKSVVEGTTYTEGDILLVRVVPVLIAELRRIAVIVHVFPLVFGQGGTY